MSVVVSYGRISRFFRHTYMVLYPETSSGEYVQLPYHQTPWYRHRELQSLFYGVPMKLTNLGLKMDVLPKYGVKNKKEHATYIEEVEASREVEKLRLLCLMKYSRWGCVQVSCVSLFVTQH